MPDSFESQASRVSAAKWLLLITAVPSKPDYLRVKLRRRTQRIGAVGLKGAVYLLPDTPESHSQFRLLRDEIVADGGEATLCSARLLAGLSDRDIVALFDQERNAEYLEFTQSCEALAKDWVAGSARSGRAPLIADRARLFTRLEEILGRDQFSASGREAAMQALERIAAL